MIMTVMRMVVMLLINGGGDNDDDDNDDKMNGARLLCIINRKGFDKFTFVTENKDYN